MASVLRGTDVMRCKVEKTDEFKRDIYEKKRIF